MDWLSNAGEFFNELLRTAIYVIMAIPLIIANVVDSAVGIFAGIDNVKTGPPLVELVEQGQPPPCGYDDYICFDIDRMFPHELDYCYAFYDHAGQEPFLYMGYGTKERMRRLWDNVPEHFRNGTAIRNYIQDHMNRVYAGGVNESSVIDPYTGKVLTPEVYHPDEDTAYYRIPGDIASEKGRFETPRAVCEDYTRRMLYFRDPDPYVYLPIDLPTAWLGYPITLLSEERTADRNFVRVATNPKNPHKFTGPPNQGVWPVGGAAPIFTFFWNNDMNYWMRQEANEVYGVGKYPQFGYTSGAWAWANVKVWEFSDRSTMQNFSYQIYY